MVALGHPENNALLYGIYMLEQALTEAFMLSVVAMSSSI